MVRLAMNTSGRAVADDGTLRALRLDGDLSTLVETRVAR
jgi:hypothetical protein